MKWSIEMGIEKTTLPVELTKWSRAEGVDKEEAGRNLTSEVKTRKGRLGGVESGKGG